jgi:hypothetical protein
MATDPVLSMSSLIQSRTMIHSIQADTTENENGKMKTNQNTNRCQKNLHDKSKISEEGFAPSLQFNFCRGRSQQRYSNVI